MNEELITFETAKLAKEKGFNLKCHNYFSKDKYEKNFSNKIGFDDDYWGNNYNYNWNKLGEPFKPFNKDCYSRPSQSLLQKWLREKHNLIVIVHLHKEKRVSGIIYKYSFLVHYENNILGLASYTDGTLYNTYEEALEQGLQEGLKLIKYEKAN